MQKYDFNQYCEDAVRTESAQQPLTDAVVARGLSGRLCHAILGVATEVNEIYDGVENKKNTEIDAVNILEEMGDVAWYLAIAYDELGTFDISPLNSEITEVDKSPLIELRKASSELLDHTKKVLFYAKPLDIELINDNFTKIAGYLAESIVMCNGEVEKVLTTNINKLKARYPEKFSEDKAENRNLANERAVLEDGLNG